MSRRCLWGLCGGLWMSCATGSSLHASPLELAQRELDQGDGTAASKRLIQLRTQNPEDLTVARMLAEAHVKAGTTDAFLKSLSTQDTAISHYQQGLVLFSRTRDAADPAIEHFQHAVALEPSSAEFRYRLGLALLESEHDVDARRELEEAARAPAARIAWQLPLAKARWRTADAKGAVDCLRALVTHAEATEVDVRRAQALMNDISNPFRNLPASVRPNVEKAIQWLQVADVPQEAIVILEELLLEWSDEGALHALLGLAFAKLDNTAGAIEELKRAIELNPDDGRTELYLAEIYDARQRKSTAEAHYRLAIQKNPLLESAWLKLGDFALERQDVASAKENYTVAVRVAPESVAARGKLALAFQLNENWDEAARELQHVVNRSENNLEFMLRLGLLHSERFLKARSDQERIAAAEKATHWLHQVLDRQPENALASRALARIKSR